jgi:competence protein ComEA
VEGGDALPASAGLTEGAPASAPAGGGGQGAGESVAGSLVNINTADMTSLQVLSGVGPVTAQKIVDYREAHGQFKSIEDIKNVSGIGEKTYEKLKDHICV